MLNENPSYQNYYKEFLKYVETNFNDDKFDKIDEFYLPEQENGEGGVGLINFSVIPETVKYDYFALMGGTQKIIADIKIGKIRQVNIEGKEEEFLIIMNDFTIIDCFGADWQDVQDIKKSAIKPLVALFWLQHHYGYKPFQTEVIKKDTYIKRLNNW